MKKSTQRSKKLNESQVTQRKMHIGTSVKLLKQRNKKINKQKNPQKFHSAVPIKDSSDAPGYFPFCVFKK